MSIVTPADLYAATTSPTVRVQTGWDQRSISYFWKLPSGRVLLSVDDSHMEDGFEPAAKITIVHDASRKCFRARIRTTSISQAPGFKVERYSLFGPFVGEDMYTEDVARFNAKTFEAFTRTILATARARGNQASA